MIPFVPLPSSTAVARAAPNCRALEGIDDALNKGLSTLNWQLQGSAGVREYIKTLFGLVSGLSTKLSTLKENVAAVERMTAGWSSSPLICRREGHCLALEEELLKVQKFAQQVLHCLNQSKTHYRCT